MIEDEPVGAVVVAPKTNRRGWLIALALFIAGVALVIAGVAWATICLDNNNPGNITQGRWKWKGAIGVDENGHIIFADMSYGIRAIRINLKSYQCRRVDTARKIAKRWISKRATKCEVDEYARVLCRYLKVGLDVALDVRNADTMNALVKGIVVAENGRQAWSEIAGNGR